jgi:membrane protein DedA with SNARE-associated domain/rhodanese-related sulfurtransferase
MTMTDTVGFVVRHGAVLIFAAVFIEQAGLPIPAAPILLAAGALIAQAKMSLIVAFSTAIVGSLLADSMWFYLGRRGGTRVLNLLCRISLEPDSCVRRTLGLFTRFGMRGVIAAKFIPGLSTLVPPLAGSSGVSVPRFFFFDAIGSALYTGSLLSLGVLFSKQLEQVIGALSGLGAGALAMIGGLATLYIAYKYLQRRRLLRELRTTRISVDELHDKLQGGEEPVILDLRSREEIRQDPSLIRGALLVTMDEVEHREIPPDRDVILYCSCPNEVSSARAALLLQRRGIARVRPLLGGIDAWRDRNYPLERVHSEQTKEMAI